MRRCFAQPWLEIVDEPGNFLSVYATGKFRVGKQITHATQVQLIADGRQPHVVGQLDETVDGTANRSVSSVDMGLHARFNRSRTAIDTWHLVVFRLS